MFVDLHFFSSHLYFWGIYCDGCNCANCYNNAENEAARHEAVEATLERNPNAFKPKIGSSPHAVRDNRASHPRFTGENLEKNKRLYEEAVKLAAKHSCTPAQLALAWVLHQGDDVVPIPGTTKIKNLNDNIGSLEVKLTSEDLKEISDAVSSENVAGIRSFGFSESYNWKYANTPAPGSNPSA